MRTVAYLIALGLFILWAYFPVIRIARDAWRDLRREDELDEWLRNLP